MCFCETDGGMDAAVEPTGMYSRRVSQEHIAPAPHVKVKSIPTYAQKPSPTSAPIHH